MSNTNMLEVQNVSKSFEGFLALDKMNMNIPKSSIYGLVGVNGSGKTTLIKHIIGLFKPDIGVIKIDGLEVFETNENTTDLKQRIGVIPDDLYFAPGMSCERLVKFYKNIYGNFDETRYDRLVKTLGINTKKNINRFSKGMQKQVAFIFTMCINPDFLVLDEPIDGLDPIVRITIFEEIIEDVANRGTTVLVSSHNLKEMDGICDYVGIIKGGRMIKESDLDTLKNEYTDGDITPSLDEIFVKIYREAGAKHE